MKLQVEMKIEQIYTGCLAQGAYYIVSNGEAAIVDPLRETEPYLKRLEQDGVKLKYILETHFHADFVSGHLDLSKKTGAQIVYGPNAKCGFEALIVSDNQILEVGNLKIKALHTPGHTMESTTYLLYDEDGNEYCIFSGDTLFIGDVGRPDLAQKGAELTQEDLAGILYDSLRQKIMILPNDVLVYPAHGAGSACGKNMSSETVSTIGYQKQHNYALRVDMTQAEFIKEVTDGLLPPPAYFGMNVAMNKQGYTAFNEVKETALTPLSATDFEQFSKTNSVLILDTRNAEDFAKAHIPMAINIGLNGDFAPWVGAIIGNVQQNLLLVCEPGKEEEAVTRLARVGFDKVLGYLDGGMDTWIKSGKECDSINRISAEEFSEALQSDSEAVVIDVRKASEFDLLHMNLAQNLPLAAINDWTQNAPKNHFILHCAGGYRSMIAASILKSRGFNNFSEVRGGFGAIKNVLQPDHLHSNLSVKV
jgi:glyoxylase-like metal-dependent hydrolase (beta-lactamase superfamily II)/rhodanese-related sulfurtransferase